MGVPSLIQLSTPRESMGREKMNPCAYWQSSFVTLESWCVNSIPSAMTYRFKLFAIDTIDEMIS